MIVGDAFLAMNRWAKLCCAYGAPDGYFNFWVCSSGQWSLPK
jgi:hypothetical protein